MSVKFGSDEYDYPSEDLGILTPTSPAEAPGELLKKLADEGYVYIPGFLDRGEVMKARTKILGYLSEQGALTPGEPVLHGVMPKDGRGVPLMGYKGITHHPEVLPVLESPALFGLFERAFGESAMTFSYKWLRAVGHETFTGAHYDIVYMGRGSLRANTVWIPLGDTPVSQGTLAICRGSHRDPGFARLRETYGKMDVDRDHVVGWFSESPREITTTFGGRWLTSDFRAGDVLIFGMYTMHASTTNTTNRYRLSCDVRYQPASEPADERWIGENPKAHYAWTEGGTVTMEQARARWGV